MVRMGRFPSTDNGGNEGGRTLCCVRHKVLVETCLRKIRYYGCNIIVFIKLVPTGNNNGRSTAASLPMRNVYPCGLHFHLESLVHEVARFAGNLYARRLGLLIVRG